LGDSPKQLAVTLHGRAKLEGEDKFAVAGAMSPADPSPPIQFQLTRVPENETKFHWRATIRGNEEGFMVHGYCTGSRSPLSWPPCGRDASRSAAAAFFDSGRHGASKSPLIAKGFSGAEYRDRFHGYARVPTDGQSVDAQVKHGGNFGHGE